MDKKQLRREIGSLKKQLPEEIIEAYSVDLTEKFCNTEEYKHATAIYAYLPYNQEVRTWDIIRRAWKDGKKVSVPKVYGDIMRFIRLESFDEVAPGSWSIPEPIRDVPVADDEDALVLMPGLAFDPEGHRMGYGGGFYDKYLSEHVHHTLVALCYPFQMLEKLETEEHDIPVHRVIVADDIR